ncbi:putative MaoC domain protein dehydratase [Candidatus Terasakiella magnetica]|uniref:Putative MaoC domain protein dehydratase n=1 Tax=Candidatus Terasakiella magnetica TaxID=1867952 RepID=A0A1C3RG95_9PROT|nr:SDR family NAD(P)-dependent oxidoreductase [Candidatus Terasakiella magnetica]SCA56279.1 putative MaoC domain protein dehydratase [Candidatus Terasakiella magnetica]
MKAEYIFTSEKVRKFAALSGDFNPVHVDSVGARRTIFQHSIVHGIYILLSGLDVLAEHSNTFRKVSRTKATFHKAARVGETVYYDIQQLNESKCKIIAFDKLQNKAATINLFFELSAEEHNQNIADKLYEKDIPVEVQPQEYTTLKGEVDLLLDEKTLSEIAPNACQFFSNQYLAQIFGTTQVVGMQCPGLHSIYSKIDLLFDDEEPIGQKLALKYGVKAFYDAMNLVEIGVSSVGMKGNLTTFVRPAPVEQKAYIDVKKAIPNDLFVNQKAMVIGGSRGLGEVVSKMLAAGGAEVNLSYHMGQDDAERVHSDISKSGKEHTVFSWDIMNSDQNLSDYGQITHLYYFASPPVMNTSALVFDTELFEHLCRAYIDGLINVLEHISYVGEFTLKVMSPSSVFVEDPPQKLGEYASAKAAMEVAVKSLKDKYPKVAFFTPRLPKMGTDLSASLSGEDETYSDPLEVLFPILSEMK